MALLAWIAGIVLLLDQATKLLILRFFPVHASMEIIPGFLNLVHVRNTGVAFSVFAGENAPWRQPLLIGLTLLVVALLLFAYTKVRRDDRWTRASYALIIGGALGNMVDRFYLGEVVDFVDVYFGRYHWPAFNVADSAITIGAVMLLVSLLRGK